jgi:hypothetical protein
MSDSLIQTLLTRFDKFRHRHPDIGRSEAEAALTANPDALRTLSLMEETGGEPDVVGRDPETGRLIYFDCAAESPKGRRSTCYDRPAREGRKDFPPADSAMEAAERMGLRLPTEAQYAQWQACGPFDQKTSSWLLTPPDVRSLGGALFGDYRYGRTFIYHNGAQSYYAARGFRGWVVV